MTDLDHLTETVSDRGLRYFPAIPCTYGTVGDRPRHDGQVEVHESSNAEYPSIWLKVSDGPGASCMMKQLTTADALRLAEQIERLCDQIDRDWHT